MKNRCLYLTKEHNLYIVEKPMPVLEDDQVLLQIKANGICGSDIHFFREGILGNFKVNEPYIPGHEASGIIVEVGKNVKRLEAGQHVVVEPGIPCRKCYLCIAGRYNICENLTFLSVPGTNGTLCDYLAVRADMVHLMPEGMSFELGALVEPASVAAHAINRAGNVKGKIIAIFGSGPIGLLALKAFKASGGGKAIMIDVSQGRLDTAKKLGADEVINPQASGGLPECIADIALETAGSSIATAQLIRVAKFGGRIVQVGWVRDEVLMDISTFNRKELTYNGSMDYVGEFSTSIQWLANGNIDGQSIITHRFDFDHAVEAFKFTADNRDIVIKTIIYN